MLKNNGRRWLFCRGWRFLLSHGLLSLLHRLFVDFSKLELASGELVVLSLGNLKQGLVRSALDNVSIFHHNDLVGAFDRCQPVRDDDRSPAHHQLLQRFLYQVLRLAVESRSGLIYRNKQNKTKKAKKFFCQCRTKTKNKTKGGIKKKKINRGAISTNQAIEFSDPLEWPSQLRCAAFDLRTC